MASDFCNSLGRLLCGYCHLFLWKVGLIIWIKAIDTFLWEAGPIWLLSPVASLVWEVETSPFS